MRIVALMPVRNEERLLQRCLTELHKQEIEVCLIDNGSTDNTLNIAESFKDKNVFRIEHLPYNGAYELKHILHRIEQLYSEIDADWFIQHDADEIRQSPFPNKTLKEAISIVDKQGYNAINFDEFVFIPTQNHPFHNGFDYVETMRYYYFYEPSPLRMVKAWKKTNEKINLISSGGHQTSFNNQRIYPESFILRHYIALSKPHVIDKFCNRVYSEKEIKEHNWHRQRAFVRPDQVFLPNESTLKKIQDTANPVWDKSDPWKKHFFNNDSQHSPISRIAIKASEKVKHLFTKNIIEKDSIKNTNPNLQTPIIIGGCYRSGTTLLRRLLDSHHNISCPPEIKFFKDFYGDYLDDNLKHVRLFSTLRNTGISNNELLSIFGDSLIKTHQSIAIKNGKTRWADKNPENVLYLKDWENLLHGNFLFILMVRNPLDTLASLKEIGFKKVILPGLKERVKTYLQFTEAGLKYANQHPDRSLVLQYEHLVSEPELTMKNVMRFIGENYESSMLNSFNNNERKAGIEDPKIATTKTIHTNSLNRWKNDLSLEEIRYVQKKCNKFINQFNYSNE